MTLWKISCMVSFVEFTKRILIVSLNKMYICFKMWLLITVDIKFNRTTWTIVKSLGSMISILPTKETNKKWVEPIIWLLVCICILFSFSEHHDSHEISIFILQLQTVVFIIDIAYSVIYSFWNVNDTKWLEVIHLHDNLKSEKLLKRLKHFSLRSSKMCANYLGFLNKRYCEETRVLCGRTEIKTWYLERVYLNILDTTFPSVSTS